MGFYDHLQFFAMNNLNKVQKVSYILQHALEFMDEKCAEFLSTDPKRQSIPSEALFLSRARTVTLGLGMQSNILMLVSRMDPDGLVVVGGTDLGNDALATNLNTLSEGRLRVVDKLALRHTYCANKVKRVVLLHDQHGLRLEDFFQWVAEQPHDETIEIIIFSM